VNEEGQTISRDVIGIIHDVMREKLQIQQRFSHCITTSLPEFNALIYAII
jgi:hypothetical protein